MVLSRDDLEAREAQAKAGEADAEVMAGGLSSALGRVPGLAQLAAFRRSATAYDERIALQVQP